MVAEIQLACKIAKFLKHIKISCIIFENLTTEINTF